MHDPTPRRRLDNLHIVAYQEVVWCMGEVLEPRAWSKAPGCSRSEWTTVIPPCHQSPIGGSVVLF